MRYPDKSTYLEASRGRSESIGHKLIAMDTKSANRINMFRATDKVLTVRQAEWIHLSPFSEVVSLFRAQLVLIDQAAHLQDSAIVGVKEVRDQHKQQAVLQAEAIANGLRDLAIATNNPAIAEQMDFTEKSFSRKSVNRIIQLFARVRENAENHVNELAVYEITPQQVADFGTLCDQLPEILGSMRNAIVTRRLHTEILNELVANTHKLLKNRLDKLARLLKAGHPDFFKHYTGARLIIDLKGKGVKPVLGNVQLPPPPLAGGKTEVLE